MKYICKKRHGEFLTRGKVYTEHFPNACGFNAWVTCDNGKTTWFQRKDFFDVIQEAQRNYNTNVYI